MGKRSRARELAFQLLFQYDLGGENSQVLKESFFRMIEASAVAREFAEKLTDGTIGCIKEVDAVIEKASRHWKLSRMQASDRNVLRLATYELVQERDTPYKVVINEAVELAKKFGTDESPAFINGILDKIARTVRVEEKKKGAR
jgi:N utilization substance protein B